LAEHTLHTISLADSLAKTLGLPFCLCSSSNLSRADLMAHAMAISEKLPDGAYAINLCQDRYLFIVAYLAVCIRKQISLLPANHAPKTIIHLQKAYPGSYTLSDNKTDSGFILSYYLLAKSSAPFPLIDLDRTLSISFTSGSTGKPKAIKKTWREFQVSAQLALQRFKLQQQKITLVSTVPMQHMYGLETSLFWVLFSQMTLHNSRPFYPEDIRHTLQDLSSQSVLVSTPRHLKSCSQTQDKWHALQFILSSTAPMDVVLAEQIEQKLHAPVFELFGSTETLSFASRRATLSEKWQPYATIQLKRQQQFVLQGGHIAKAQVLDDNFDIDSKGFFTLLGRSADLIKIAGKRTSLNDLNNQLTSIKGIEDGVFFCSKNERLSALVVSQLPRQTIIQHLKQAIDEVFLPRAIYSVTAIPRNEMGKINKTELEQLIGTQLVGK
jgi:acyl-coenzyme A synthetase/AMP-(fatty) acid ligase